MLFLLAIFNFGFFLRIIIIIIAIFIIFIIIVFIYLLLVASSSFLLDCQKLTLPYLTLARRKLRADVPEVCKVILCRYWGVSGSYAVVLVLTFGFINRTESRSGAIIGAYVIARP